jgi:hypothetical protein
MLPHDRQTIRQQTPRPPSSKSDAFAAVLSDAKKNIIMIALSSPDLDLSDYDGTKPGKPALFYPFTTTLLEIILNREPVPTGEYLSVVAVTRGRGRDRHYRAMLPNQRAIPFVA